MAGWGGKQQRCARDVVLLLAVRCGRTARDGALTPLSTTTPDDLSTKASTSQYFDA